MERISYQDIPQGMFEKLTDTENFINNSSLDMKLLELIRTRVSQINGCAYCVDMHNKLLKHEGETDLRLNSLCIWESTPYFSEKEIAVLKLTDALTKFNDKPISNNVFNSLLKYFDKSEISYLTLAIAQINTWTSLMKTFKFTPGKFEVK
ncbi:carboxymuconolactone decarboxylase family protein [uncultured Algibacter sp.]|uniref:carboxymuconolactone decarboxylase family protein n=1 Tax=uncultured Algibacter sp. TaxID=298659 RepID=UPI002629B50B|nr:carboxymuconolactone decarboxylase family protein [uncultured Algibacter sp.]